LMASGLVPKVTNIFFKLGPFISVML